MRSIEKLYESVYMINIADFDPSSGAAISRKGVEEQVLHHFRIVLCAMREHLRMVKRNTGVSGGQLWALSELKRRPGMKVGELGEALSIHVSTASNLLDKLEKKGLIRRARNNEDRRAVRLYLTEEGTNAVVAASQPDDGLVGEALGNLSEHGLSELHRSLTPLIKSLSGKGR